MESDVVDICNLRCKHCAHFAHVYKKNQYPFDEFKNDLNVLSKVLHADSFYLCGGEPLMLGKNVEKYIACIRESGISDKVGFITNGILLPKFERIIPTVDEIVLSVYKSRHYNSLIKWMDEKLDLYPNITVVTRNTFETIYDPNMTKEESDCSWKHCEAKKTCNFLYKGNYYKCAQSIKILDLFKHLGISEPPIQIDKGIDLYAENLESRLATFINTDIKLHTCNVCRVGYIWAPGGKTEPWRELTENELV